MRYLVVLAIAAALAASLAGWSWDGIVGNTCGGSLIVTC